MITKQKWMVSALLTTAVLGLVACAKPPDEKVRTADQALTTAKNAEASTYAPQELADAEEARRQLSAELAAQQEKFAMMRSYDRAEQLAAEAENASQKAVTAAREEKERQRNEAVEMLAAANENLAEVKALLATAPRTKGAKADLAALGSDLAAAEAQLDSARLALEAEKFSEVRATVKSVGDSLEAVRTAVREAQQAVGRRASRT